jgi:hypothetical protein
MKTETTLLANIEPNFDAPEYFPGATTSEILVSWLGNDYCHDSAAWLDKEACFNGVADNDTRADLVVDVLQAPLEECPDALKRIIIQAENKGCRYVIFKFSPRD